MIVSEFYKLVEVFASGMGKGGGGLAGISE
jgi:hypothetical protein